MTYQICHDHQRLHWALPSERSRVPYGYLLERIFQPSKFCYADRVQSIVPYSAPVQILSTRLVITDLSRGYATPCVA